MKRRRAREYALQMLFQHDLTDGHADLRGFWNDKGEDTEVTEFAESLARGTMENLAAIDAVLQEAAEHWVLTRMAAVDRNILRVAAYEILYRDDIPSAVSINEALEIAKRYSSSESAAFINGILDRIARQKERA
ncbi:MAG: transcription antitermination factor NusB [Nitrospirota bacterium]|jgi:N utilization substance protein B